MKYLYCFRCGAKVDYLEIESKMRAFCRECNLILYENPIPTVVALVSSGDKILLVKRGIEPGKGGWSLPGGFIEMEETPIDAVLRELCEETNLKGKSAKLIDVIYHKSKMYSSILLICYEVEVVDFYDMKPGDDSIDVGLFEYKTRPELVFEPHEEILNRWWGEKKKQ